MGMAMGIMSLPWSLVLALTIAVVSASDEVALLAFREQISDGGALASWNSSAGFCSWEGVTCGRWMPKRAVALRLDGRALVGALSPALGNLTFLRTLNLSFNWFHGEIPASLGRLHRLRRLDLSDNCFSSTFPICKTLISALTNSWAQSRQGSAPSTTCGRVNMLYGSIPDDIGSKFPMMKTLALGGNHFTGTIPSSVSNISSLVALGLVQNGFSGYVPPTLGKMGALQYLNLADNKLEANDNKGWEFITSLANCSQLQKLILSNNSFGGQLPGSIVNLSTSLQQLYLDDTRIFGSIPADIGNLVGLNVVLIANTSISGVIPDSIGSYGAVYKCVLDNEERTWAVKVFNLGQSRYSKSFETECEAMRRIRHRCLVKIITSCSSINQQGQEFKALIFEFMPNGNLAGWLHPKSQEPTTSNTLSLAQRLDIGVDIVDAVEYLHNYCQPSVIHCDLKPSNILLSDNMSARVGDFGISRILQENTSGGMQNSYSSIGIRGSIGYVAPGD
ncbi:unnamed protein product [Triticum turgidum subsp. durum]|uniref:Protein kinase domain-containing protein n=1 Tax=Triticum turgidum subsp. durum TaxID=4567 RepID=A0A9R1Q7C1_TRITD|nr:unnamed protein product [Triticum turgidum subsp. durum]